MIAVVYKEYKQISSAQVFCLIIDYYNNDDIIFRIDNVVVWLSFSKAIPRPFFLYREEEDLVL